MIEHHRIVQGQLVWWKAKRQTGSWSCPGVITRVEGGCYYVFTFDDFKEHGPLYLPDDNQVYRCQTELRPCSGSRLQRYLKGHLP